MSDDIFVVVGQQTRQSAGRFDRDRDGFDRYGNRNHDCLRTVGNGDDHIVSGWDGARNRNRA